MSDRRVRIPRSARRRRVHTYTKLIERIIPPGTTGFDWVGQFLTPNSLIQKADLWPSPAYPRTPILLEYIAEPGWGHRRRPGTYILWVWEDQEEGWRELARTRARSYEWCAILGPVAERFIRKHSPPEPSPKYSEIAGRVTETLERELAGLDASDRTKLLCLIHDFLIAWLSANPFGARPELQFRAAAPWPPELWFQNDRSCGSDSAAASLSEKKEKKERLS